MARTLSQVERRLERLEREQLAPDVHEEIRRKVRQVMNWIDEITPPDLWDDEREVVDHA